jgi:hypothetical protein
MNFLENTVMIFTGLSCIEILVFQDGLEFFVALEILE